MKFVSLCSVSFFYFFIFCAFERDVNKNLDLIMLGKKGLLSWVVLYSRIFYFLILVRSFFLLTFDITFKHFFLQYFFSFILGGTHFERIK